MGRRWVRQEIKKDAVVDYTALFVKWFQANRRMVLGIGGGIAVAILFAALFINKALNARNAAWEKLAMAQSYGFQGQEAVALEQTKSLETDYPQAPATGFGILFAGDLLYRDGKYKEAAEMYQKLLDRNNPQSILPNALSDLGIAQEAAGDCKSAVETDQRFLDTYQDHYLAPLVHASLARCLESLGEKDKAKATYERIGLLYPDTYWAHWAQEKLKS